MRCLLAISVSRFIGTSRIINLLVYEMNTSKLKCCDKTSLIESIVTNNGQRNTFESTGLPNLFIDLCESEFTFSSFSF